MRLKPKIAIYKKLLQIIYNKFFWRKHLVLNFLICKCKRIQQIFQILLVFLWNHTMKVLKIHIIKLLMKNIRELLMRIRYIYWYYIWFLIYGIHLLCLNIWLILIKVKPLSKIQNLKMYMLSINKISLLNNALYKKLY